MKPSHKDFLFSKSVIYLIIILFMATIFTALSAFLSYKNAVDAAGNFLKLHAIGVAISLEASLPKVLSNRSNVFKKIIEEGTWEGIAFIALYDGTGLTVLHSNESLNGQKVADKSILKTIGNQSPEYSFLALGTGERVFVLDLPARAEIAGKKQKFEGVLRVALHTYPIQKSIGRARLQATAAGGLLVVLWGFGVFFVIGLKRSEEMKRQMAARESLAVLGEMASVLAHEIRNPLGSIKGFAQYLLEKGGAEPDYLKIIVEESGRLESLTEELLLYAKPSEPNFAQVELTELVNETVDEFCILCKIYNFSISIPSQLSVSSDRNKLKQILLNLLHNAADALADKGEIHIFAFLEKERIVISVKDNGCGMDLRARENAFVPFFTTKAQGTGLGLAIVERLTTSIGGCVTIESSIGLGTTVTITLPSPLS